MTTARIPCSDAAVTMTPNRPRFGYIDALRGLAAVAVMVYHYGTGPLQPLLAQVLPGPLVRSFSQGWLGVHVFFVLSGFVIAYAVGRHEITARAAALFAVRRQVRLDPPYWVSLALSCAVPWMLYFQHHRPPGPSLRDIGLHVLYLQELMRVHPIQPVYWTLCIEVQFYLVFVLSLALLRRVPLNVTPWILAASGLWGLQQTVHWSFLGGWFIPFWHLFALGAATWWSLDGRFPAWAVVLWCAWEFAQGHMFHRLEPQVGALVALSILVAGRAKRLDAWLSYRPLVFLGKVSYGVYLLHPFVGAQVRWHLGRALDPTTPWGAVRLFVTACACATFAAWLLHVTVERRALAWASRIKWQPDARPRGATAAAERETATTTAAPARS